MSSTFSVNNSTFKLLFCQDYYTDHGQLDLQTILDGTEVLTESLDHETLLLRQDDLVASGNVDGRHGALVELAPVLGRQEGARVDGFLKRCGNDEGGRIIQDLGDLANLTLGSSRDKVLTRLIGENYEGLVECKVANGIEAVVVDTADELAVVLDVSFFRAGNREVIEEAEQRLFNIDPVLDKGE